MIDIAVLEAMVAAGATAEVIVAAIKADGAAEAERKADAAAKKRLIRAGHRKSQNVPAETTTVPQNAGTSRDMTSPPPPLSPPSSPPSSLSPITPIPSTLPSSPSYPPALVAREIDDHNFDKPERERASRLPKEWEPNGRDLSFATRTLGGLLAVEDELAKFRDHWAAKPGAGGRKLDWDATWRNWVRTAKDRQRGPPRTPSFIELENELRKAHAYDRPDDDQTPDLLGDHFTDPPD